MAAQVQPLAEPPGAEQPEAKTACNGPIRRPIFMARIVMNWCRNSRTNTGKKEAVRLGHRKLIGTRLKRPCARTCWLRN